MQYPLNTHLYCSFVLTSEMDRRDELSHNAHAHQYIFDDCWRITPFVADAFVADFGQYQRYQETHDKSRDTLAAVSVAIQK